MKQRWSFEHIENNKDQNIPFENLDFRAIVWELKDNQNIFQATTDLSIEEQSFQLVSQCTLTEMPDNSQLNDLAEYIFTIKKDSQEIIQLKLTINVSSNEQPSEATTYIERKDRANPQLPKEYGVAFYNKMLKYLDFLAQKRPILHVVYRMPNERSTLSEEEATDRWNQRFVQLLKDKEYTEPKAGKFEKLYNHL